MSSRPKAQNRREQKTFQEIFLIEPTLIKPVFKDLSAIEEFLLRELLLSGIALVEIVLEDTLFRESVLTEFVLKEFLFRKVVLGEHNLLSPQVLPIKVSPEEVIPTTSFEVLPHVPFGFSSVELSKIVLFSLKLLLTLSPVHFKLQALIAKFPEERS